MIKSFKDKMLEDLNSIKHEFVENGEDAKANVIMYAIAEIDFLTRKIVVITSENCANRENNGGCNGST